MEVKVFHEIPSVKSQKERINILVQRHANNYFIEKELESIDQRIGVLVRPTEKVTKKNLLSTVSYDMQAKIKKIHWVLSSQEDFASSVKTKHENGEYKSFREMYNECAPIYEENCPNYCKSKATVSSVGGKKIFNKKIEKETNDQNGATTKQDIDLPITEQSIKENMVSKIKNNVDKFISLTSLSNDELKSRVASNERFEELSNIASLGNPSRKETRLIFLSIATMLDTRVRF